MGTVVRSCTGTEEGKAAGGCNRLLWTVVLHFLCFKIISLVGVVVYNQPREGIAAFPVLYEQGAWWIAYMFAGIIVPVFLSVMWKKLKGKQEKRYSVVK